MDRTKLLRSNRSKAVRIRKDVALPTDVGEVVTTRDGAWRAIAPADALWDDFFAAPGVDLPERDQPEAQARPKL